VKKMVGTAHGKACLRGERGASAFAHPTGSANASAQVRLAHGLHPETIPRTRPAEHHFRDFQIALTGTRVPLNSHAPPTLPETRSTAEHWLQSSMAQSYVMSVFRTRQMVAGKASINPGLWVTAHGACAVKICE
jgi:hypothetical protein